MFHSEAIMQEQRERHDQHRTRLQQTTLTLEIAKGGKDGGSHRSPWHCSARPSKHISYFGKTMISSETKLKTPWRRNVGGRMNSARSSVPTHKQLVKSDHERVLTSWRFALGT